MASKNIKGITIQIGSDVTKLDEGLKKADKSIKTVRSELMEVEKALKLNPSNTELVAQKQKLLAEQVSQASDKLKLLKNAQSQVEEQFKNGKIGEEQYRAFQRELSNTQVQYSRLISQQREYSREQNALHRATESLKEQFKGLGTVLGKVAEQVKKIASGAMKALQISFKTVSAEVEVGMKAFQAYIAGLTTATTAIGAFAVKNGATFEASMSKVQSLSGATGDDLKALEDAAREMGATTSKSASEAADALGYMALAGWDNQQMLTGLEPILRASEAGEMDLARCSDLVTDSMSAMGIQTDELAHYLDVVTNTQNNANTSMQQMLEAYVGVGGTLKNMNVPLDESATLIGILANRGIKGSEAGTSLNSVLVNLMGTSGQASEALAELGVSMYDDAGNRKTVTQTLTELDTALKNCTESQRDQFTAMIGGKTQMDTLQALISGLNEEYSELNGKIQNSSGVLMNTAQTMQDNFNGSVTAAKSAIEGLGISIFQAFSPKITEEIRHATGYISMISEAVTRGNAGNVIKNIMSGLAVNAKLMVDELANGISEGTEIFNTVILAIVDLIIETLPSVTDTILPALLTGMFNLINGLIERLPSAFSVILDLAVALITQLLAGMSQSTSLLAEALPEILETAFEYLSNNLSFILTTAAQIIMTLVQGITALLPQLVPMAISLLMTIVNTLLDHLDEILDAALQLVDTICQVILDNLDLIIDATIEIIAAICTAIVDNLDKIIEMAIEILITLGASLIEFAGRMTDYIPELIGKIKDAFMDYDWAGLGKRIMESIFDGINNIGEKAKDFLGSAGEHILDAIGFHPDGTFSLSMFADGGVLTSGSAIVGEAGPELLSVAGGRAVVTPLTDGNSNGAGGVMNSPTYNFTSIVNVESISSDYDINRIGEQLAIEQRNAMDAVGGW